MRKFFICFVALLTMVAAATEPARAQDLTVTFSSSDYVGQGTATTGSEYTMEKTDLSIKDSKFYGYSGHVRLYADGVTTVTPAEGVTVKQIVITTTSSDYTGYQNNGTISVSTGSIGHEGTILTWTGTATEAFTLSHNKQIRWYTIEVTYEKVSNEPVTHVVTQATVDSIFGGDGYTLASCVKAGDTLDFQDSIDIEHSLVFNKQVTVVSSTHDAVVMLNTPTSGTSYSATSFFPQSFVITAAASGSSFRDIKLFNTETWFYNASNVTFTGVTMHVEGVSVGAGVGHVAVRFCDHVAFDSCTIYTKNNGGSASFVFTGSSYCTVQNCTILSEGNTGNAFTLGNTFNTNDMPVGFTLANDYNKVLNNTFTKVGTTVVVQVGGKYGLFEGNTVNGNLTTVFGASQPESLEQGFVYRNNTVTGNLYSLNYSTIENNTVNGTLSAVIYSVVTGNTANGISVLNYATVQGNTANSMTASGSHAIVQDNTVSGNVTLSGSYQLFTRNIVNGYVQHSNQHSKIIYNKITSTEEYAVKLTRTSAGDQDTVQYNVLISASHTGDEAVQNINDDASNVISNNYATGRTLTGIPEGWTVQENGLPVELNGDAATIAPGFAVKLLPSATDKPNVKALTVKEASAEPVLLTTRDADSNWTFVMPNNDALVSITYKDSAHLAWTYNSAAMPAEGLTAYRGFELPVIGGIGASMDHDFLTALLGGTVSLRYGSTNPAVISFTDANDMQSFRVNGAGVCDVYMVFAGNDDYQRDSVAFHAIIQTPPLLTLDVNNSEWGSVRLPFEGNIPEQLPDPEPTVVATPVISGELLFTDSVIVTMSCATSEADIYYTKDGSTNPKCDCSAAPEYKHPIVLKETTTIKAAAYTGNDWSAVATMTFTKVTLPDGVAYVNDSTFSVLPGTEVKVIATPTDSTYFVNWDEETALNSNTAVEKTLTMGTAPATLTANFAPKPTLTLAANDTTWGKVTIEGAGSAGGAGGDVTIGDSTSNSVNAYIPGYTLYDYAYSQQIYTADEIGLSGDITSLTMWLKNTSSYPRNLEVYMKEVDRSAFADNTDWELLTSDNMVASGTMDNGISTPVNYTFNLTTPFHYSGTGNLLLCIRDVTGSWSSGLGGVTMDVDTNQAIYAYRDGDVYDISNPGVNGTLLQKKNVVKFHIESAAGSGLPAGVVKIDSVTYRVDYGTQVTVNAQATELHHVQGWDNGNGTAMATATYSNYFVFADPDSLFPAKSALTFTMTNDTTVRALFGLNSYDVTARATVDSREVIGTDTAMGVIACVSSLDIQGNPQTVAPDSVITYTAQGGSTSKLVAQPYYGYLFKHWQVGDDVYLQDTLTLTAATEVVAVFVPDTFSFATTTNNFRWGTVEADANGRYPYLSQMTLEAVPTIGNHFVEWSDGDTNHIHTISLTQDTVMTATFARTYYTVVYNPNEEGRGTISCEHPNPFQSNYGYTTHMKATAEYGYHFVRWQNAAGTSVLGLQDSIDIVVTKDTAIVAVFELNNYTITAQSESATKGSVTGSGSYLYLSEATLTATAKNGYHFTQWNDGDTLNPRTVEVLANATYTAQFAKNLYTVTVVSADTAMGTASGTATVEYESSVQLTATANEHYHFVKWNDGVTGATRTVTVREDVTYTATFAPDMYTITGLADQGQGSVTGSGSYAYLANATLTAKPACGYLFDHWSNLSTESSITVQVTGNETYTAFFRPSAVEVVHDTVEIHDTTTVEIHDSVEVPVYVHDTTTVEVPVYVHDTTMVEVLVHDTTTVEVPVYVHDTTTVEVPVYVHDTTTVEVPVYVHDTTTVEVPVYVHDTTTVEVPVYVHDTTTVEVPVYVHDTTTVEVPVYVHDTTTVEVPVYVHDTTTVEVPVYVHDTTTVVVPIHDTVIEYVEVHDTLWLTEYIRDTVYIEVHDTVYIHDTIFVGIDEVDALDAKIYASNGQIVVEGAEGSQVVLYDVTGRVLAIKRDEYSVLRFDIPASGTYLVKIGNHAARRIVMIR